MWNSGSFSFIPFHKPSIHSIYCCFKNLLPFEKHSKSFKALNYYYLCLISAIGRNKLNLSIAFTIKPPQADLESKKKKKE